MANLGERPAPPLFQGLDDRSPPPLIWRSWSATANGMKALKRPQVLQLIFHKKNELGGVGLSRRRTTYFIYTVLSCTVGLPSGTWHLEQFQPNIKCFRSRQSPNQINVLRSKIKKVSNLADLKDWSLSSLDEFGFILCTNLLYSLESRPHKAASDLSNFDRQGRP